MIVNECRLCYVALKIPYFALYWHVSQTSLIFLNNQILQHHHYIVKNNQIIKRYFFYDGGGGRVPVFCSSTSWHEYLSPKKTMFFVITPVCISDEFALSARSEHLLSWVTSMPYRRSVLCFLPRQASAVSMPLTPFLWPGAAANCGCDSFLKGKPFWQPTCLFFLFT